jgi:hypothetical protein
LQFQVTYKRRCPDCLLPPLWIESAAHRSSRQSAGSTPSDCQRISGQVLADDLGDAGVLQHLAIRAAGAGDG